MKNCSIFRCKVPECEFNANNRDLMYDQAWLSNAVPQLDEKFDNCYRYAPKNLSSTPLAGQCTSDIFDTSKKIACTEYVYTTDEKNIQTEVWKDLPLLIIIFSYDFVIHCLFPLHCI